MRRGRQSRVLIGAGLALVAAACGGASGPSTPSGASSAQSSSRPNIVVILVDDMATGLVGSNRRLAFLNLPNLEKLASGGVQFKNAFVTTSLCSPSRATILSGLYAHAHGVLGNESTELPASVTTFPQLLQTAGYKTAFVGKWHMDSSKAGPRPGFDYWVSFAGQGVYENPVLNVNGAEVHRTGYITDILTDYAVSWLRTQSQPFLLFLSHKAPHQPWTPPLRDTERFLDAALPEPSSFLDTFKDKPSWQRRYAICGGTASAFVNCPDPLPAILPLGTWLGSEPWRLEYLRTLFAVDDSLGSVESTLSARGLGGNTYVFFMSDNGFMLGEHRFGDKRVAYEDSMRIPFLVGGGGLPPHEPAGMVLNLDVAPTILELAGVPIPVAMQGRSLAHVLRGEAASVRDAFLYEYFSEASAPVVPEILGIRATQDKLITYPTRPGEEEFYDLASDPNELANLANRSEWTVEQEALRLRMARLLQESDGDASLSRSALRGAPRRLAQGSAKRAKAPSGRSGPE